MDANRVRVQTVTYHRRSDLTLLDRTSDVIVTGGMNVYSTRVERVLRDHPDIDNADVIGIPDDGLCEAVHAVVGPRTGTITLEDIDDFLGDRLSGYKQPKSIANADSLPTTTLGTVDRRALRARYWDEEDRSVH